MPANAKIIVYFGPDVITISMGLFLALSSVVNQPASRVVEGLKGYLKIVQGGMEQAKAGGPHRDLGTVMQEGENVTVLYPSDFLEWDECSQYLSKQLDAAVFSFHINDGDLWMYTLFVNGELKDKFCPIPDYWEDMSEEEMQSWQGDADTVVEQVPYIKAEDIERYLVRWDLDQPEEMAYPDDVYENCDWQLTDFMRKLRLPFPIDDEGVLHGQTYRLLTQTLPPSSATASSIAGKKKLWWKFW